MYQMNQQQVAEFCIHEFCMTLSVNSNYFLKQQKPFELCNVDKLCFYCGMV
jgi:hypothetical protein